MDPPDPDDYERIKPLKKGKPYSYKCRYCGAPGDLEGDFCVPGPPAAGDSPPCL